MDFPESKQETLAEIEKFNKLISFESDDIVYHENEDSVYLYLDVSGQVDIQYLLKNGCRKTIDIKVAETARLVRPFLCT